MLEPGAEEAAGGASGLEVAVWVGEVAGVDLGGAEVFEGVEAGEVSGDLGGGEEELEGLSGELDAGGEGVPGELFEEGEGLAGLAVVEDDPAAGGAFEGGRRWCRGRRCG